jgi:hypothetical protein
MGWSLGYDSNWNRDIGYGVPAICDHPKCKEEIDRGLGHVCGGEPYGGEHGCGLFFCEKHLFYHSFRGDRPSFVCERCDKYKKPFKPKPNSLKWIRHKLLDPSWNDWRVTNPHEVKKLEEEIIAQ